MELSKEITTPLGEDKVVIKTILTAAEREQVLGATMPYVKTSDGKQFEVTDMKKVAVAEKHELIKVSVLSINGDETDTFPRWHKMYEHDADFVYEQIIEAQKKMMPSTSPTS